MNRTPRSSRRRASRHLRAEVGGPLVVEAVHGFGPLVFAIQIDGFRGGRLHLEGQLVRLDSGRELRLIRVDGLMLTVEVLNEIDRVALRAGGCALGRREVQEWRALARNSVP